MIEAEYRAARPRHGRRPIRDGAALHLQRRRGRGRLHQSGQRAILRAVRPHPPDRRRPAAHLPLRPDETDLRAPLRSGASDDEIEQTIRQAVWGKELKHYIGDKRFRRSTRSMSMIGG